MFSRTKFTFLAVLALCLMSCKEDKKQEAEPQVFELPAIKLEAKTVPLTFEYPARARGFKDTEVRSRVDGILLKRYYVEGSKVNEGDLLFKIDPAPYIAALNNAKGKLADAKAQLAAAQTQWNRISKLYKDRIVSEKSRDDAKASLDSLKATVESAEAEVKTAELNLEYTTVTAPIGGTTSLESQSEGSLINTSTNSLLTTITQLDPIYIMFSISDTDIFNMKMRMHENLVDTPERHNVYARVKFTEGSFFAEKGEINFIDPTIDPSTGTVTLRAIFPNPNKIIMPQQFVRIVIEGVTITDAITIPQEAVMQGAEGPFVYTITPDNKVAVAPIKTGHTAANNEWVVTEGLKAGDVVVVGGLMKIKAGMPAKPDFDYQEQMAASQKQLQEAIAQKNKAADSTTK